MLALEQLAEMVALDKKIKASTKELKTLVLEPGRPWSFNGDPP
jgi:hypothetical protein